MFRGWILSFFSYAAGAVFSVDLLRGFGDENGRHDGQNKNPEPKEKRDEATSSDDDGGGRVGMRDGVGAVYGSEQRDDDGGSGVATSG